MNAPAPPQDSSAPRQLAMRIAAEMSLPAHHVERAISMLAEGNSVPFLARYRKEATGGLDEVQLRDIDTRKGELEELEARRAAILKAIDEQGKLNPALKRKLLACATRAELEDLYLPYKKKRRTRASTARERGLEPLATRILAQPRDGHPSRDAARYVHAEREVPDADAALAGARDIVAEIVAEDAEIRAIVREAMTRRGALETRVVKKLKDTPEAATFRDYFDNQESISRAPSHRILAMLRGEREGVLRLKIAVDTDRLLPRLLRKIGHRPGSPYANTLREAVEDGYKRLLAPSVGNDVRQKLKERADAEAIEVFAANLRDLLLAAPAGGKPVIAIDPGLRTGCKCAALDATGRFLDTHTIHLVKGDQALKDARRDLLRLVDRHRPFAVVVGNGTGGRETLDFVRDALRRAGHAQILAVSVSEAGASIYSASDIAREEFPDLDLTVRGAISIGRRFQDPLAELVKLDPKAIGVGQYQHDVHQGHLQKKLAEVVEDCVHAVGVNLNTASAALLGHVSGVGPALAKRIVEWRDRSGPFRSRKQLQKVPGLGPRTFEQAAGFLRIAQGEHPLDASAVHPERYKLVERIARDMKMPLDTLVGNTIRADRIDIRPYVGAGVGEPTLRDIIRELKKPGRDPRESFEAPAFRDDVHDMNDLREGMQLEGVVTNVTHFGAFVDVGVHQDGLVHISQLADRFVKDPHEIVKVGGRVKVRVLEVDLKRKRISLSMK